MPLNIAPVSVAEAGPSEEDAARQLRNELRSQHVQVDDTFGLRELRSLSNRRKIAEATRPLIEDASQRLLRREVKAVQRMMTKQLSGLPSGRELRGTDGLHNDLEEFYHGEFTEVIAEALLPVIRSYAREIYTQAALEVGFPPEFTPELEEFIRGYVSVSAAQHAQTSRQELQSLISTLDFTELLNALELKLAEWLDTRAQKMAKRQTTEGNGAFSKFTYIIGGVISMRWVTAGAATCPFCRKLNGKVVETFENFINAGETLEVIEEDDTVIGETSKKVRLVPRKNVGHPPAHPGCDCFVSPGL